MTDLFVLELEPEVRLWLETLLPRHYRQVEEKADLLVSSPTTLGEPHSRSLGEGVRELRFSLDGNVIRVSYWLAPGRRTVMLTVFRKIRMREEAEVKRAKQAKALCETEHGSCPPRVQPRLQGGTVNHSRWRLSREREAAQGHGEPPEVVAEREQIRLALDLGQLVHDRRSSLGLPEAGLGERLGMTTDDVETLELGGMLPVTADLLVRVARALDVAVDLHVVGDGHSVSFEEKAA